MNKYYENNKEIAKKRSVDYYYYKNRDKILESRKQYRKDHKEEISIYKKEYYKNNKTRIQEYKKKYAKNRKDYLSNYFREYQRNRRNSDNLHKFKMQIRHLIWLAFNKKGSIKSKKTEEILGCDLKFFIEYLLETYKNIYGIEYDNEEKVHIDHIIPLSTAKNDSDIIKLCHYSNLRLLKAKDNLKKSNKIEKMIDIDKEMSKC